MAETANNGNTSEKKASEKKTSFIKGLEAEFKKIVWPDQETVQKQTVAVIVCSVFLGLLIGALDLIIKFGLSFIL